MTGTLQADFSAFSAAAQKAIVSLGGMEGSAKKVETAVDRMAGGGVAPLNSLRDSFGQVDQVLNASGVNIGKYARGLVEISEMAGKTVSSIGLLASGASVFGAAMAGYQFGIWIAGFTGLDTWVLKAVDSLTGLGAAAQGAVGDTLVLASSRAKREITSLSEAIQINTQWQKEHTAELELASAKYAVSSERLIAAQREVRGLSSATIDAIEIAKRNGATTEQITKAFGISADGLRALADRQKLAGQAADAHTKFLEKQQAAAEKLNVAYDKLMSDTKNANQLAIMEADAARMGAEALQKKNNAAAGWIAQQVAVKKGIDDEAAATAAYLKEQDALTAATDGLGKAHFTAGVEAKAATDQAVQGYQGVAQAVQISGDAIKEWINLMRYSAEVNAILSTNSLFTTTSQHQQIAALGGPFGGGSSARSGGASVVNNINIVDTEANLARRVSERVTDSIKRLGPV